MQIASFFDRNDILPDIPQGSKEEVLRTLAARLVLNHPGLEEEDIFEILLKREQLRSTGMEDGVAFPHGRVPGLDHLISFFALCRAGVDFKSFDGKPTYFFFVLLIPEDAQGVHLKALARLNGLLQKPPVRQRLLQAQDVGEIYSIITEEDGH
jgi:PTS system nitrogen regulatory IIA component